MCTSHTLVGRRRVCQRILNCPAQKITAFPLSSLLAFISTSSLGWANDNRSLQNLKPNTRECPPTQKKKQHQIHACCLLSHESERHRGVGWKVLQSLQQAIRRRHGHSHGFDDIPRAQPCSLSAEENEDGREIVTDKQTEEGSNKAQRKEKGLFVSAVVSLLRCLLPVRNRCRMPCISCPTKPKMHPFPPAS